MFSHLPFLHKFSIWSMVKAKCGNVMMRQPNEAQRILRSEVVLLKTEKFYLCIYD